ncbi:DUF433 domain-containing protein [Tychonema sp. LEGE 07199]|uniref:DUF433 domain-containing protein n=1 Tax=unclassified Tychonema TaxID=2642144 RepID=UPI0018811552|nr:MULTISPECIES: DUF433 domain-containing protein [unclassified Tychonema]MBE9122380.1 DUF433 domain-containing protein [Tychonema sp. LEGE 07199]MBE9134461.1 DUF433 domain-containing protein [Tychonema sp. LEGE 07196]
MTPVSDTQATIIRTERGLTISGTRLTLYDVIDFLKAEYSPKLIRNKFNLTDDQINTAMSYIEANRDRLETEYQQVLQTRAEIRSYWENRNRERFDRIAMMPHKPGQEALWAKLEEQKARRAA